MLTQMNSTLEEENRMLMEQMNKLLTQVLLTNFFEGIPYRSFVILHHVFFIAHFATACMYINLCGTKTQFMLI